MEKIDIIFKILRRMSWMFIWDGILAVILGLLIYIYPELLSMFVGVFLILSGILFFVIALKIRKYSKVTIKLE